MPTGTVLKDEALTLLERYRKLTVLRGRRAFLNYLLNHPNGVGRVEDIRDQVPLPPGVKPHCLGPIPLPLQRSGIIAFDGYVKTKRPESHSRPICRWRLVNRFAALEWLRHNPEPDAVACDGDQRLLFATGEVNR